MEPTGDGSTISDDLDRDDLDTGEPEVSHEPDEQVALDRLTAAFAELLGPGDVASVEDDDEGGGEVDGTAEPDVEIDEDVPAAVVEPPRIAPETSAEPLEPPEPPFPISPHAILEAMLFVGSPDNQPLSPKMAAARLRGVSPREVETLVQELNETYRSEGCPYTIESSGEGFRMVLRPGFESVRERFYGRIREARLSQAAIDILALVAYHQPIAKNRVDEIRSKPSGGILSQLVRRRLLRIERTETKPRVTLYYTTDRFLELFSLDGLNDLPRTQDLDTTA